MGLPGYCPGGGYIPDAAVTKTNAKITIFGRRRRKIRVFTIFVYFLSSFVLFFHKEEFKSCKYIEQYEIILFFPIFYFLTELRLILNLTQTNSTELNSLY